MDYDRLGELLGLADVDAQVARLEDRLAESIASAVPELQGPAARVVRSGGKRLRPLLVLAVASAGSARIGDEVLDAAVAVELIHVGTLVHDDVMDAAQTRRGVPTVNAVEGWKDAILIGDYLFGRAGERAAAAGGPVAAAVAEALTAVTAGQALETAELFDPERSVEMALRSISGKTAALVKAAYKVGALCAGMDDNDVAVLSEAGFAFGMGFQLVDDLLDIVSSDDLLGKPTGIDIPNGIYTVPVLYARERIGTREFLDALVKAGEDDEAAAECLAQTRASGAIEETTKLARSYAARSAEAFAGHSPDGPFQKVARFPSTYIDWALSTFAPAVVGLGDPAPTS